MTDAPDPNAGFPKQISVSNTDHSIASDHVEFKYWAFISYSHADTKWAEWLHRQLETFPVPRLLVGRETKRGYAVPKRLFPVFRDREELPGSSNLAENIDAALRASRYLIVICSPRSAVSLWVNQEVIAFKAMWGADRVLCLVVDGEPNATYKPSSGLLECFPPGVRYGVGSDGQLTAERQEPIAADAREGKDGRRDALIKVVSGLLGVGFDELKQRDMARRRRMRVLWSVAVVVLMVVSGLAVRRIWEERRLANREAAIARAVNDFLINDVLRQAGSRSQADSKHSMNPNLTVREALERAAARIGTRFKSELLIEARIRETIGLAYHELGDYTRGGEQLEKALALLEAESGAMHPVTLKVLSSLASLISDKGDEAAAEALCRRALAGLEKALGANHPYTLDVMSDLAAVLHKKGDYLGAEMLKRRSLAGHERVLGPEHPDTVGRMNDLAAVLTDKGDLAEAEPLYRRALALKERDLGPEHPDTLLGVSNLANLLLLRDDYTGSEPLYRRALASREKVLGPDHPETLWSFSALGALLTKKGDYQEAEPLCRRALAGLEKALGPEHPETLGALINLAGLLHVEKDYSGSEPLYRRVLAG